MFPSSHFWPSWHLCPPLSSAVTLLSVEYNAEDVFVFAGENVVRGDKESIKNLLEIFDGLLEYLKEEISEESQDGGRQINFLSLLFQPCVLAVLHGTNRFVPYHF